MPRVQVIGTAIATFLKKEMLEKQFAEEVPTQMNGTILAQASQVPVPFSRCDPTPGAGGDASCSSPLNRSVMIDVIGTAIKDKPKAAAIIGSLRSEGFVCLQSAPDDPTNGQCWWHPVFERVNVLPTGIETVWENAGDPISSDRQLIQLLAPNQASCNKTTGTNWTRVPTYVPKNWYGEEMCGGCIPLP